MSKLTDILTKHEENVALEKAKLDENKKRKDELKRPYLERFTSLLIDIIDPAVKKYTVELNKFSHSLHKTVETKSTTQPKVKLHFKPKNAHDTHAREEVCFIISADLIKKHVTIENDATLGSHKEYEIEDITSEVFDSAIMKFFEDSLNSATIPN